MKCSTADCEALATRLVKLLDADAPDGPHPYCWECAGVLINHAHDIDCGPVEIPDEMVERAAKASWDAVVPGPERYEHVPCRHQTRWDRLRPAMQAQHRERIRVALTAAFQDKLEPQEGS